MKLSYKMLKDLNKLCDAAAKLYEEYYVKDRNYDYTTEISYFDMYNMVSESFENGYLKERNIEFDFGKAGTLKNLKSIRYSVDAILYYPGNVIYHNEFKLSTPLGETLHFSLSELKNKKKEILDNLIDKNKLCDYYKVTEIEINQNNTIKFIKLVNEKDLEDKKWYLVNTNLGERIQVNGKDNLLEVLQIEYNKELSNYESLIYTEQKIEETVDKFSSWLKIEV